MRHTLHLAIMLALLTLAPTQAQRRPEVFAADLNQRLHHTGEADLGRPERYEFIKNGNLGLKIDPRALPLKINAGNPFYRAAVRKAVNDWNSAGLGKLFELTSGPADITIDWTGSRVSPGARAETRLARSPHLAVPVALSIDKSGRAEAHLVRTIAHELGHVLGLGHSEDPADIMFESELPLTSGTTSRDRAMLRWLYSRPHYTPIVGLTHLRLTSEQFKHLVSVADGTCQGCPNEKK